MKSSIQVNSVIVCDDIRREHNGKAIFIGVFSGDILLAQYPASILLSFWFSGNTNINIAVFEVEISLKRKSDSKEDKLFKNIVESGVSDEISENANREFHLALIGLPVHIEEDSILTVKWRTLKGRWRLLSTKNINLQA